MPNIQEYERFKAIIAKKAKDAEEYERLISELVERLKI